MKKILLVAMVTSLSACHLFTGSQPQVIKPTAQHFVGKWECAMSGVAATTNKVNLSQNGKATYLGNVMMPADKPLFNYSLERSGTWAFADNSLTYTFTKGKIARSHSAETQAEMEATPDLAGLEQQYFDTLSQQIKKSGKSTIKLTVSNFTAQSFNVEQKTADNSIRTGQCVKVM